jgi:hypothetical protein
MPYLAPTYLQSNTGKFSGSTINITYIETVTFNSYLVCIIILDTSNIPTCADNLNGSWGQLSTWVCGSNYCYIFGITNTNSGTPTVTISGVSADASMCILEYSNCQTIQPLVVSPAVNAQSNVLTTNGIYSNSSNPSNTNNNLIIGICCTNAGALTILTVGNTPFLFNKRCDLGGLPHPGLFIEDGVQQLGGSIQSFLSNSHIGSIEFYTGMVILGAMPITMSFGLPIFRPDIC